MRNVGFHSDRLELGRDNPREVAFAEQWEYENKTSQLLNRLIGQGPDRKVTKRERQIAATLMQWLGSNVGMSFIWETMQKEPAIKKYLK